MTSKPLILTIDDDPGFGDLIELHVVEWGYAHLCISGVNELDGRGDIGAPAALLLDLGLMSEAVRKGTTMAVTREPPQRSRAPGSNPFGIGRKAINPSRRSREQLFSRKRYAVKMAPILTASDSSAPRTGWNSSQSFAAAAGDTC
jgi:hypothetical protein